MVLEATESCCSPSLRSSVLAIFEGRWGDSDRRLSKCFGESDRALSDIDVALISDIDTLKTTNGGAVSVF